MPAICARSAVRAEMRSIRDKYRNVNLEKIETEIRELEYKLQHESLADKDEKAVHSRLLQLNTSKPFAKKYAEYDQRLKEGDAQRAAIMARMKESDAVIAQLDTQIQAQSAVLDEAKAKADSHSADLPSLQVGLYAGSQKDIHC